MRRKPTDNERAAKLLDQVEETAGKIEDELHDTRRLVDRVERIANQAEERIGKRGRQIENLERRAVQIARGIIKQHVRSELRTVHDKLAEVEALQKTVRFEVQCFYRYVKLLKQRLAQAAELDESELEREARNRLVAAGPSAIAEDEPDDDDDREDRGVRFPESEL